MVRSVHALNGHGLDLTNIDHTTEHDIDAYLIPRSARCVRGMRRRRRDLEQLERKREQHQRRGV